MKGKVVRFNPKKGFGFIRSDDEQDIFFHYSSLNMDGFKTVNPEDEVEFDLEKTDKGLRASNIKILK
jgi:CspA family cold shock protein